MFLNNKFEWKMVESTPTVSVESNGDHIVLGKIGIQ